VGRQFRSRAVWLARIGSAATLALTLAGCATMESRGPSSAAGFALAPPPSQFVAFCARFPGECQGALQAVATVAPVQTRYAPASGRTGSAVRFDRYDWSYAFALPSERRYTTSALSPAGVSYDLEMRRLIAVNREVNRSVRFRSDDQLFGTEDYWSLPVRGRDGQLYGDCEDYALQKRSLLLTQGFSPTDLSMAVVRTAKGDVHAVLLVSTDAGEMMLDSLTAAVIPWRHSTYRLVARQAAGDAATWVQPG
jgi:predicted transglutaminase-like cysteine proteinase